MHVAVPSPCLLPCCPYWDPFGCVPESPAAALPRGAPGLRDHLGNETEGRVQSESLTIINTRKEQLSCN